jgi:PAS domain S-box-containing protein
MNDQANILLVDDRPGNLLAMEAVLEPLEQNLVRAYSGVEALSKAEQMEFAVVLLDIQMPGLDGFETAMRLRATGIQTVPIIFLTAAELSDSAVARGYEEGASDVIQKPYKPEVLRSKVRVFVELYFSKKHVEKQADQIRRAHDALRQSRDYYKKLFDNFPALVWTSDVDGKRDFFNETWLEFTGQSLEREINNGWLEGIHPDDRERCSKVYNSATEKREPFQVEYRLRHNSGRYRTIIGSGSPYYDQEGVFAGYVGSCYDITARKEAEEEVRKLNAELETRVADRTAELESTVHELESFSYSISHDLRTPLRSINAYARLLLDEEMDQLKETSRRYLTLIFQGAVTMGNLIDGLLAFSRLGRHAIQKQWFGMDALMTEVQNELMFDLDHRKVEFHFADLGKVYGDKMLIKQVVANLISNALKFSANREVATIEMRQVLKDECDVLLVKDNGIGFDMKYADKLFRVFERLHRQDEFEGSGVGLAIAHRIVTRHGGEIWFDSKKGDGAIFYFSLPRS